MIKNIVFDLGNVLVEFNPQKYMKKLGFPKEDLDNLFQIIFTDNIDDVKAYLNEN